MILALLAAASAGQWAVIEERDPMTDSVIAQASVRAPGGRIAYICGGGDPPRVAFEADRYLGPGYDGYAGSGDVQFRFDDAPAQTQYGWFYRDRVVTSLRPENTTPFVESLREARRLRFRAIGRAAQVDADLDVSGAGAAIVDAERRCGVS
jgi:hypothetical protein